MKVSGLVSIVFGLFSLICLTDVSCVSSVADKSTRYVAQENVIPLGPEDFTAEDAEGTFDVQVGRWFKRFDAQTARFVSNVLEEYPED